ncbi:MAG: hypothetical protein AB2653_18605 [Candidatus Thiodiazotropha endolucinida]
MDKLSTDFSGLNMAQKKRSFVDAFLSEEAVESGASKKTTRLELARAKNRKEKGTQNLLKTKERVKALISRMREQEAEVEAADADIKRLKDRLQGDDSD